MHIHNIVYVLPKKWESLYSIMKGVMKHTLTKGIVAFQEVTRHHKHLK